jgi:hypothetical protein
MPIRKPAKQVRFAYATQSAPAPSAPIAHYRPRRNSVAGYPVSYPGSYLPPALPALSSSASTLQSSAGPITPPNYPAPLPYHRPQYAATYPPSKPRYQPGRVMPHRYLLPNAIQWIMQEHYSTSIRGRHRLSGMALHEPATEPPRPVMHIFIQMQVSSEHMRPFWVCTVHPSNGRYVTLLDVLENLYRSIKTNITQVRVRVVVRHGQTPRYSSLRRTVQETSRHRPSRIRQGEEVWHETHRFPDGPQTLRRSY